MPSQQKSSTKAAEQSRMRAGAKPNRGHSASKPLTRAMARVANRLSPRSTSGSQKIYESIPATDKSVLGSETTTFDFCNSSDPCCTPSNDNLVCLREETRKELQCLPPSEAKEKRLICEQSYELRVRRCFYEDPCPVPTAPTKGPAGPPGAPGKPPSKGDSTHWKTRWEAEQSGAGREAASKGGSTHRRTEWEAEQSGAQREAASKTPSKAPSSTKPEESDYLSPRVPIPPPSRASGSQPKSASGEQQLDSGYMSEQGSGEAIEDHQIERTVSEERANGEQEFADEQSEKMGVAEENGRPAEIPTVELQDEDLTEEEEEDTTGFLREVDDDNEETLAGEKAYDEDEFRPGEDNGYEETGSEEETYAHENEEEENLANGFEEEQGEEDNGYEETGAEEETYAHENKEEEENLANGFEEEQGDVGEEEDAYETASKYEEDLEINEEDGMDTTFTTIEEEDGGEDYMEKGNVISQIACSYRAGSKDCSDRLNEPNDIVVAKISRRRC